MVYYCKDELQQISIKKYLGADKTITKLLDDDNSEFILDNADVFRQGVCQLFAYALHKTYKYPVYKLSVNRGFHIFCKSENGKYYIDVRGITSDFEKFIKDLDVQYTPVDKSCAYIVFIRE